MKNLKFVVLAILMIGVSCKNNNEKQAVIALETTDASEIPETSDSLNIIPISHATMVLEYGNLVFYIDPVGGVDVFKDQQKPDYVLITDIHGDHMDPETLKGMDLSNTTLVVPKAVADQLPELKTKEIIVLANGETKRFDEFKVEAVPMYNLRAEALKFHEKGRGNGYVLQLGQEKIYISGDTEDITEMRNLQNIDIAFVCMNLPYTMTVDNAASAVLEFKPKKVYPYHYRGTDGLSDVDKFKTTINNENPNIEVVQLNWYK